MGKYLKEFENLNGYTAYTADTENFLLPNVSYCVSENEVYMTPYVEPIQAPQFIARYNVTEEGDALILNIFGDVDLTKLVESITLDNVELDVSEIYSEIVTHEIGPHELIITLKEGVTEVEPFSFGGCTSLTSITIPNVVTSIAPFQGCTSLTSITIPNSVTSIGEGGAFQGCTSLASCTIGNSITSIGGGTFYGCISLTSCTLGSGVTSIGSSAFAQCSGLTNIVIPNSVTSIGDHAFQNCTSLTSINIPNSDIGSYAFHSCSGLTSCTIGSGVTSIGDSVFYYCTNLASVTCLPTTPPTIDGEAFDDSNNCPIYVPSQSVDAYKNAEYWSYYGNRIRAIPEP